MPFSSCKSPRWRESTSDASSLLPSLEVTDSCFCIATTRQQKRPSYLSDSPNLFHVPCQGAEAGARSGRPIACSAAQYEQRGECGSAVAARNELYQDAKRVVHFTTDGFRKRNALHAESLAQLGARQSHFTMSSSDRLVAGSVGAWETRRPPAAGFPLSPSIPRLSASTPPIDESASRGHRTAEVASQNPTAVLPPTHVRRVKSATGSSRRPLPARRRPRKHTTPALPERHRRTGASMQRHEEPTQVTSAASSTSRASTSTLDRARAPPVLSSRVASGSRGRLLSGRRCPWPRGHSRDIRAAPRLSRGDRSQQRSSAGCCQVGFER